MRVYFFQSDRDRGVCAYSADVLGGKLPTQYAPWRSFGFTRTYDLAELNRDAAEALARDGYHLMKPS